MKARKAMAMGLIAAMSVGMLAGCGGEKKEDGKETADGKQKLTISTWDNDTSPQFKASVEVFQEKYPDITIQDESTNDSNSFRN